GRPARDPITRWVTQTMRRSPGMSLDTLLDRALDRAYSANPCEVFFTGGGRHVFHNFDPDDNHRRLSVREGTARAANLVFVRLMRDLVRFHQARLPYNAAAVLADRHDPDRKRLLEEVAEDESRTSLGSAYRILRRPGTDGPLVRLLGPRAGSARGLAILF